MENLYGCHYSSGYSEKPSMAPLPPSPPLPPTSHHMISSITSTPAAGPAQLVRSGSSSSNAVLTKPCSEEEVVSIAKVASHPLFPDLLDAYINCSKVGAPAGVAEVFDIGIIRGESNSGLCQIPTSFLGADPELDDFMETYCNLLVKFKSDLSRPFDEATAFLVDMETQLNNIICNSGPANVPAPADEATGTSEEDFNSKEEKGAIECKRVNEDRELKDKLLRRYSGYISSLKQEVSKKKKKEKLPREARQILLAWWNIHFKSPYPTEADKVALAEWTGLDQKQVNNWFINQRKRHWKPMEEMKGAILNGLYGPLYMSESD